MLAHDGTNSMNVETVAGKMQVEPNTQLELEAFVWASLAVRNMKSRLYISTINRCNRPVLVCVSTVVLMCALCGQQLAAPL